MEIKINHKRGLKAEDFFCRFLVENNIDYIYVDDYYDFDVGKFKVEVKSCRLTQRCYVRNKKAWKVGRFDFTNKSNRDRIFDENIFICFIVTNNDDCMIIGFIQSGKLLRKRYISLHQLRDYRLLSKSEFVNYILQNK